MRTKKELKREYEGKDIIAHCDIIGIFAIEYGIDDRVVFAPNYLKNMWGDLHARKIYYNNDKPFFIWNGKRQYFKDFLRVA